MSRIAQDASGDLWSAGQSIKLTFVRTSPTTGSLSWTLPSAAQSSEDDQVVVTTTDPVTGQSVTTTVQENPVTTGNSVYNGILITASVFEINPSNYPTDSVVYQASANLLAPADRIGQAVVVGAFYDDTTTTTLQLTGLEPNSVYYCSAHVISNVNTYYTIGTRSYPQTTTSSAWAHDVPKSYGPPENPTMGQCYYDEEQRLVFSWDGAKWQAVAEQTTIAGEADPRFPWTGLPSDYPKFGNFFYNTTTRTLKIWTGAYWRPVETDGGVPNYKKQGVGTDLSSGARQSFASSLKLQLGYPVVCVELTDAHFNLAIDKALAELRRRADNVYTKKYFITQMLPGQSTYYLNDPTTGTNAIVDVTRIWRLNMLGLVNFGPDNIYAQAFMSQFYAPGVGYDLVSIHLITAMSETYTQIFAGEIAYNWTESTREMEIYRSFVSPERVIVEATCERLEQELLQDRWTYNWLQMWAKSEAMFMLAMIRGKYATLPGPGGSLQLNADTLLSEAQRLQEECIRQAQDFEIGQNGPGTFYAPFVIG